MRRGLLHGAETLAPRKRRIAELFGLLLAGGPFAEPLFPSLIFLLVEDSCSDVPGHGRRNPAARPVRTLAQFEPELLHR